MGEKVLVPGYAIHSIGALLTGISNSYPWLLGARAITGLSQGTYFATQYAISSASVPLRYRTVASAITMSGSALGIGIGTLLASLLVWQLKLNWRIPILFFGVAAFLLTIVMQRIIRPDHFSTNEQTENKDEKFSPSGNLIRLFLVGALSMYGFYVIVTWLPYYLQTSRGIEGGIAGAVSTLMPLATIPSAIIVGILADRTGQRRSIMAWLIPLGALALAMVVWSSSMGGLYLALILYGLSGKLVIDPLLIAAVAEQTAERNRSKAFAFLNFAGTISMVLAPTITGLIVDFTGSFNSGFLVAAALQAIAWILLLSIHDSNPAKSKPSDA